MILVAEAVWILKEENLTQIDQFRMVLKKGKFENNFRFHIAGTAIPTISEKPVRSLGKMFDSFLRDTRSIKATCIELVCCLKSVDKSGLPGKFNAWVYQQHSP